MEMVVVLVIAGLIYIYYQVQKRQEIEARIRQLRVRQAQEEAELERELDVTFGLIEANIQAHLDTLIKKRRQTLRGDEYGLENDDAWRRETAYFHERLIKPLLTENTDYFTADATHGAIEELIQKRGDLAGQSHDDDSTDAMSPKQYEEYCAERLRSGGWQATTTKSSGDQGIDILAEREGVIAVFQCKLVSSPVGNKAVQEALGGKAFANADVAFVVSNAQFTESAQQLASVSGVRLLHHSELADLTA